MNAMNDFWNISLQCQLLKVLKLAYSTTLTAFSEKIAILKFFKYGFRTKSSTTTTLKDISSFTYTALNDKGLPHVIFRSNTRIAVFHWIVSYLCNRKQLVVLVICAKSYTGEVLSGVPQGSILGPLLF